MYICAMKRQKKSESSRTNLMIYHHELNLECSTGTTYWIITEIVDNVPVGTYYYKIPESYKDNHLLGEMHEKYCMYSPN
jgi:hypothetical protein